MSLRLVAALVALTLSGCARIPPTDLELNELWSARQVALSGVDAWEIRGRLAIQTAEQAEAVSFVWRRRARHHAIEMFGAFGGGRVRMTEDPGQATFFDRKGNTAVGASAEALFFEQTGWRIPFSGIVYWVVGLPEPGHPYDFDLDPQGRLANLSQRGWEVAFINYAETDSYDLPGKVFAEREQDDTNAGGVAKVKLAIRQWRLPGVSPDAQPPAERPSRGN